MKKLISVLCLISLATPLFAQQGKFGLGAFSFITPLQVAGGQDSNFLIDRASPEEKLFLLSLPPSVQLLARPIKPEKASDQFLLLTLPTVAFLNESRRHQFTATYMPEIELFRTNSDQNAWNHDAAGTFTYFLSRTAQITVADSYRATKDPVRALKNVFLLLPRSQYRQNAFRTSFDIEATPLTGFGIRYINTRAAYAPSDPFQVRMIDTITDGFSFSVRRMITRNHRLTGTYSAYKNRPINRQRTNDDTVDAPRPIERPVHSGTLAYRIGFSPSSVLEFEGGVSSMDTGTDYVFRVAGDRRLWDFWVGAGYSRSLAIFSGVPTGFPNALNASSFYDVLSFRLKGQPMRRIGLQLELSAARDASGRTTGKNHSLLGRARLDHRLTDRTVTFASFESYQQDRNDYVRSPFSRNRFLAGIEFSLSTEAERRTNPLNKDGRFVALTDHAIRRQGP